MSEAAKTYFKIDTALDLLKTPLFSNRYVVTFSGAGSKTTGLFDSTIGLMANSVSMPSFTYNVKQQYVGGININIPNSFEQGQLDITLYNTGKEYYSIQKWGELHYDQNKKTYSYVNDILVNIQIMQYDRSINEVLKHIFSGCTLYTFGGVQLSYEESSAIETFNLTVQFRGYTLTKI